MEVNDQRKLCVIFLQICTFNKSPDPMGNSETSVQSNGCLQRPQTKCKDNDEADEQVTFIDRVIRYRRVSQ